MQDDMTRLELLTVLLAIRTLLEDGNTERALKLVNEVISECKRKSSD